MLCAFDFDGTLADSRVAHYHTVHLYAKIHGFPMPPKNEMDAVFGNPEPSFIFEGWTDNVEVFKRQLLDIYGMADDVLCNDPSVMPLFEGIPDLLDNLRHKNIDLAIVTSRSLNPLQIVMQKHKIDGFFKTIRSHHDVENNGYRGKPYPDKLNCVLKEFKKSPREAIMIGDTSMDMQMAKNAAVRGVGVSWGYHPRETLKKHGAVYVAETVSELSQAIGQQFAQKSVA